MKTRLHTYGLWLLLLTLGEALPLQCCLAQRLPLPSPAATRAAAGLALHP
jgi:hypothetical protein